MSNIIHPIHKVKNMLQAADGLQEPTNETLQWEREGAKRFYLEEIGFMKDSSPKCDEAVPLIQQALSAMIDYATNHQTDPGVNLLQMRRAHRNLRALQLSWQVDHTLPESEKAAWIYNRLIEEQLTVESNTVYGILHYPLEGAEYLVQGLLAIPSEVFSHTNRTDRNTIAYSLLSGENSISTKIRFAQCVLEDCAPSMYNTKHPEKEFPMGITILRDKAARFILFSYIQRNFSGLTLDGEVSLDELKLPTFLIEYINIIGYKTLEDLLSGRIGRSSYLTHLSYYITERISTEIAVSE